MVLILALTALLVLSCTEPQYNNPYDPDNQVHLQDVSSSSEISSSSVEMSSSSSSEVSSSSGVAGSSSSSGTPSSSSENDTNEGVTIGTQVWMKKNLNIEVSGSRCYAEGVTGVTQDSINQNCEKYGRLYDWATAITVCPSGWHLPTQAEWNTLSSFIKTDKYCSTDCDAKFLKAEIGWVNGNGFDAYGFAALPGGNGRSDGHFANAGYDGNWWSATERNTNSAYYWYMGSSESADWQSEYKTSLFNVRCVRDD